MNKFDITKVPMVSMNPCSLTCYTQNYYTGGCAVGKKKSLLNLRDNAQRNKISEGSQRKVLLRLQYLLHNSKVKTYDGFKDGLKHKHNITFVTLTLASRQQHSDQELTHRLLNQFLIEAKYKWNVNTYIWRAERQANLNLHYHIITDVFIPWSELRDVWNRIQNKLGYVDEYRNEQRKFHMLGYKERMELVRFWPAKQQKEAYERGKLSDWRSPNSTDIHGLYKIKNAFAYICKYVAKEGMSNREKIKRLSLNSKKYIPGQMPSVTANVLSYLRSIAARNRLWGSSSNLSKFTGAKFLIDSYVSDDLRKLRGCCNVRIVTTDYFTVFYYYYQNLLDCKCEYILKLFNEYLQAVQQEGVT